MNNAVVLFFKELLLRLSTESPRFFKIIQVVMACLTFAGYLPAIMDRWFGIQVSDRFVNICVDIATHTTVFFAASLLPSQNKPVALSETGEILKKTDEKKLPFTAKAEEKQVVKELKQSEPKTE